MKRNNLTWISWLIIVMAFFATALSFLDRQVLSISIVRIREDFHITNGQYGLINTCFLVSYAFMFSVGGVLIDRFGSRLGLAYSVGLWSLSTFFHGIAQNAAHFGVFRFLLGLGEGGAFPGAIKAVVEWVPQKHRALANGIAIGGSALGAVIAPPLCVYLIASTGWRNVFFITGITGMIWVLGWMLFPKPPRPKIRQTEITFSWSGVFRLLKIKEARVFIVIRFLLDPIFYFYMFWIPKYLSEIRDADLEQIGSLFWIPFLALGISNMLGGWMSDRLLKKTENLNWSRKTVMGFAALLTTSVLLVKYVSSVETIILLISVAFFAHGLWITSYITSTGDLFGKTATSTIVGFSGTAGALSSMVINPFMGLIIARWSYDPLWIYAGLLYPVAFVIFLVFVPNIRPVRLWK